MGTELVERCRWLVLLLVAYVLSLSCLALVHTVLYSSIFFLVHSICASGAPSMLRAILSLSSSA